MDLTRTDDVLAVMPPTGIPQDILHISIMIGRMMHPALRPFPDGRPRPPMALRPEHIAAWVLRVLADHMVGRTRTQIQLFYDSIRRQDGQIFQMFLSSVLDDEIGHLGLPTADGQAPPRRTNDRRGPPRDFIATPVHPTDRTHRGPEPDRRGDDGAAPPAPPNMAAFLALHGIDHRADPALVARFMQLHEDANRNEMPLTTNHPPPPQRETGPGTVEFPVRPVPTAPPEEGTRLDDATAIHERAVTRAALTPFGVSFAPGPVPAPDPNAQPTAGNRGFGSRITGLFGRNNRTHGQPDQPR